MRLKHLQRTAGLVGLAAILLFSGVWIDRYNSPVSWTRAQNVAIKYGVSRGLFTLPLRNISSQEHHRWRGVWLEPYYFFETGDTGLSQSSSSGVPPSFVELTVSGRTGTVVAQDVSPRLKPVYPIQGFNNH